MDLAKKRAFSRSGGSALHTYRDHDNHVQINVPFLSDDGGTVGIVLIRNSNRASPTGLDRFNRLLGWRIRSARRG